MRIGRGEEQWERVFELCPNQGGVEGPRIFNVDYSASFHPPPRAKNYTGWRVHPHDRVPYIK